MGFEAQLGALETDLVFDFRGLAGLDAYIDHLIKRIKVELVDDVATLVREQTRARIKTEKRGPEGEFWPPRKGHAYNDDGHGLLYDTGELYNSIEALRQGDGAAQVNSFSKKARTLNAARPFMGVGAKDRDEIADLIETWVEVNAH